nr:unnamed protein product [Callosobruchus analis]
MPVYNYENLAPLTFYNFVLRNWKQDFEFSHKKSMPNKFNATEYNNDDMLNYIYQPFFSRRLKGLHLISKENPLTDKYFRSESAVKQEVTRHIRLNYWYIVHPLSKLSIYFDIWQLLLYIASMIVKPITSAVPIRMRQRMTGFDDIALLLDVLCWITIVFTFFQGYIIRTTKVTVLEPKRIAWLISVVKYTNRLSEYFKVKSKGKVFLLICIIMTIITVHGFALLQLLIPRLVRQFFAKVDNTKNMWFVKYGLHLNSFWTIYTNCVLKIIVAVTVLNNRSMEIKFYSIINQLDEYMRQKQLPLDLRDRIKNYYNFRFQHKYFNSERIHETLPEITHVYMLKKKDFNVCLLKNPKVMKRIIKAAHERFNQIRVQEESYKKMLFEKVHGVSDHMSSEEQFFGNQSRS